MTSTASARVAEELEDSLATRPAPRVAVAMAALPLACAIFALAWTAAARWIVAQHPAPAAIQLVAR